MGAEFRLGRGGAGRGGEGAAELRFQGGAPASGRRSAVAFHPSGPVFYPPPPPSIRRLLSARRSPRSIVARPFGRPIPQCRAPTGTWGCRWRRERKARMTASGKQNTPPSTPCWTRSTPVWTTWRRRMTTSTPASRSCWSPTGRHAWSSSSNSGRTPAMPAPRLQESPTGPPPCLPGLDSGLGTHPLA
uniref:Uncharacterized protein n=1 Tax=Callithrix jacchus TaxID=9483 RepID=A0A8I3W6X8_CALJA